MAKKKSDFGKLSKAHRALQEEQKKLKTPLEQSAKPNPEKKKKFSLNVAINLSKGGGRSNNPELEKKNYVIFTPKERERIKLYKNLYEYALGYDAGEEADWGSLSTNEKITTLLYLGKRAKEDFDHARENEIGKNRISYADFLENFAKSWEVDQIITDANINRDDLQGEYKDGLPSSPEITDQIAEMIGVDKSEIAELWQSSTSVCNFKTRFHDNYLNAGVCRDISVYIAALAHEMGLKDVVASSLPAELGGHVIWGFRNEDKNIVFVNWGKLIETNTPNMRAALADAEKLTGAIGVTYFQSKGKDKGSKIIPVKSEAAETLQKIARGDDWETSDKISQNLSQQKVARKESLLGVKIDKREVTIDLNMESIAGTTMLTFSNHNFDDRPTNSIEDATTIRAAHEYDTDFFRAGLGTAYANMDIKEINTSEKDREALHKLLLNLYLETHLNVPITKRLTYQVTALGDAILDLGLNEGTHYSSSQAEVGMGHRVLWVTQNLDAYTGLKTVHSLTTENLTKLPEDPMELEMVHDLIAGHVGVNIKLGQVKAHRVSARMEAEYGTQFLGLASQFEAKGKLEAKKEREGVYMEAKGKTTKSNDFRLSENRELEANIGTLSKVGGGILEIKGFAFYDKSTGQFADNRLDDYGVGFKVNFLY
ncbi:hypothetical protein HOE67_04095 [Candidatus Peregrinibacteria bacterium]|jgi:hypothetical protein|nr:hypothetical protein [Candidatus Peregrinibacteria bacterium]MBT4056267.1 hypothetical protein [Candidatus Peregrinibacteria bacterium]